MATSLDTILQGLREAGGGLKAAGEGFAAGQEIANRNEAARNKAESERLLSERLGTAADAFKPIAMRVADDPNYTREEALKDSQPIIDTAIRNNDPGLINAMSGLENIFSAREKNARATAQATASAVKEGNKAAKEEQDLNFKARAEIRAIKDKHSDLSKNTRIRGDSFKQIQSVVEGEPSAAGDLSLIFSYMKVLDPPSTVREGEQALAEQARGVPETVRNLYNKVLTGERLTPEQRADFANQSETIYRSALNEQKLVDKSTMNELEEIAGKDKSKLDLFKKKVFAKTAEEELSALDAKKAARKDKNAKDAELGIGSIKGEGAPKGKVYGRKAADAIVSNPQNQASFAQFQADENAARQAAGQQPMNDSEKNQAIIDWAKEQGIIINWDLP